MARTRSIRPGFFTNDSLGELPPVVRLLFAGLWTVADRDGRLLDRPRKLKAELLAYDNVNVDKALDQLAGAGFIERYQAGDEHCIQIHNWLRHQRPHPREEASMLPAPEGYPASTPEPDLEPDPGAPPAEARPRPGPPGTLSSSSSSSGSDPSGADHPLRGNPPTPKSENDPDGEPGDDPETCPECELPVDRNGAGHGLSKRPGRVRNCSLDHLKPYEWQQRLEAGVGAA
jgi:hypothetical protein